MMAHMSSSYGSVWPVGPGITFCALFRALYSQITNTGLEIKRIFFWLVWRCFWSDWSFACLQNFYYRQHHSCCSKIQNGLTFWLYQFSWVYPLPRVSCNMVIKQRCVAVCVHVFTFIFIVVVCLSLPETLQNKLLWVKWATNLFTHSLTQTSHSCSIVELSQDNYYTVCPKSRTLLFIR